MSDRTLTFTTYSQSIDELFSFRDKYSFFYIKVDKKIFIYNKKIETLFTVEENMKKKTVIPNRVNSQGRKHLWVFKFKKNR